MHSDLEQIKDVIIGGRHKEIEDLVRAAIKKKDESLDSIINEAMIAAMDIVGQKFADSEIFVPEMLVSAMTMKKGLDIIKPLLQGGAGETKGTIIMCTVKGDMHDIGKNLVTMMLEGAGFNVVDLGVDMSVEKVIQQVEEAKPDILGLSALLTTTMPEMRKVIEALEEKGLRSTVKVIIGGAPVDSAFAEKIGADGYGDDATEAVRQARRLIAGN
jgi:5-methyltetrahydrofolate--homocysteine methyltransferase